MKHMCHYLKDIGISNTTMYKIPEDFNINSIKNEAISQIAFGLNIITLFFNNGLIQFSGSFSFHYDSLIQVYEEVYPVQGDFGLLHLLEKRIVQVRVSNERNVLTLEFETGAILELISGKEYESFKLNIDGEEIIV